MGASPGTKKNGYPRGHTPSPKRLLLKAWHRTALPALFLLTLSSLTAQNRPDPLSIRWPVLAGTATGLYGISRFGVPTALWEGGSVRKIIHTNTSWMLLTDMGITVSTDLEQWETRNQGLPVKTIKLFENGRVRLITQIQDIKDLEVHPTDPEIMVCATVNAVFLSQDGGRHWENLGMPQFLTNGLKAVGVAHFPELTVLVSHSVYGVFYLHPQAAQRRWIELSAGLETLETTGNPDEVSDIAIGLAPGPGGSAPQVLVYAAQTFRGRIYSLDWERKRFVPLWPLEQASGTGQGREAARPGQVSTTDSLTVGKETLRFVQDRGILELTHTPVGFAQPGDTLRERQDIYGVYDSLRYQGIHPLCIGFWDNRFDPQGEFIALSELWLLDQRSAPSTDSAAFGKRGLYLPVNHAMEARTLNPYLELIADRNLNMVVIDMKDDYGRLRFDPQTPGIGEKGRVFRPLDVEEFIKTMQDRGIYTVARIVVFKDPELARRENGRYAVWDARLNQSWAGYYTTRRLVSSSAPDNPALQIQILPSADPNYETIRTFYDERWVDPYSEIVWEYIADIGEELIRRGFDEIQLDYIRFPTDGENLGDAQYRWRNPGMDVESAMISFLQHIRERIDAPISVDIYGANGWYRTGARTGQEVEMLAPYVDVICPMYYPSHFEQSFLAQTPPELRPYRIYYQGTERLARIARGRIIVRPYIQAFYLNVSYDRQYYNTDYVRRQMQGVEDAGNSGYTFWNNSGRYEDIPRN